MPRYVRIVLDAEDENSLFVASSIKKKGAEHFNLLVFLFLSQVSWPQPYILINTIVLSLSASELILLFGIILVNHVVLLASPASLGGRIRCSPSILLFRELLLHRPNCVWHIHY